jgi:hypothetical protein
MRRKHKSFIANLAIFGLCFIFAGFAVALVTPVSFRTADNSKILFEKILKEPKNEVLGASTELYKADSLNACPEEKPVIGWIDYQGQKIVVNSLGQNQKPSVCFKTIDEATAAGFVD